MSPPYPVQSVSWPDPPITVADLVGAALSLLQGAHHLEVLDGRIGGLHGLEPECRFDQELQLAVIRFGDVVPDTFWVRHVSTSHGVGRKLGDQN